VSRRIAILGGAGFVGTNLALAAMDRDYDVVSYDTGDRLRRMRACGLPSYVDRKFVDLAIPGLLFDEPVDAIVHLAALPHVDYSLHHPDRTVRNNVGCLAEVLAVARRRDIPVLFTSSVEVYGGNDGDLFREDAPLTSLSPYAASKIACEAMIDAYRAVYGVRATTVRLTNLYGPWQAPDRVIPRLITQCVLGRRCQIVDGRFRDFLHVDDVVSALLALLELDEWGGVYNIATGEAAGLREIGDAVLAAAGAHEHPEVISAPPDDGRGHFLIASSERMQLKTGWKPKVSLAEGVERTVAWYRQHQDWWAPFTNSILADRDGPTFILDHVIPL
jgi:dTDP-glucose 4,6-dehydratase